MYLECHQWGSDTRLLGELHYVELVEKSDVVYRLFSRGLHSPIFWASYTIGTWANELFRKLGYGVWSVEHALAFSLEAGLLTFERLPCVPPPLPNPFRNNIPTSHLP